MDLRSLWEIFLHHFKLCIWFHCLSSVYWITCYLVIQETTKNDGSLKQCFIERCIKFLYQHQSNYISSGKTATCRGTTFPCSSLCAVFCVAPGHVALHCFSAKVPICDSFPACRFHELQRKSCTGRHRRAVSKCKEMLHKHLGFVHGTEKGSADSLATEHIQVSRYGFKLFDSVLCRQLKHLGCLLCSYYLNNLLRFSCQMLGIANIFRKFCGLFPVVFNSAKFFVLCGGIK